MLTLCLANILLFYIVGSILAYGHLLAVLQRTFPLSAKDDLAGDIRFAANQSLYSWLCLSSTLGMSHGKHGLMFKFSAK